MVAVTTAWRLPKDLAAKDVRPFHGCVETLGLDVAQMELQQPRVSLQPVEYLLAAKYRFILFYAA